MQSMGGTWTSMRSDCLALAKEINVGDREGTEDHKDVLLTCYEAGIQELPTEGYEYEDYKDDPSVEQNQAKLYKKLGSIEKVLLYLTKAQLADKIRAIKNRKLLEQLYEIEQAIESIHTEQAESAKRSKRRKASARKRRIKR